MKKIPTMFERDWNGDRSRVVDKIHEGCEWVSAGEGIATRKIDGTSCLVQSGSLWKRRELRLGDPTPPRFQFSDHDEDTGKTIGWVPVEDLPEDRWHREAFALQPDLIDGTYELIGPKVQGNPERSDKHRLVSHRETALIMAEGCPRTFSSLKEFLTGKDIEGVVFHHPDGRMAKIKLKDFGLKRPR